MTKIIRIDDLQDGIRGTFLQRLSPEDLKRKLAESYLGVLTNDDTLANPFGNLSAAAQDNINQYLVWIMSQPEYFYFLIKVIFQMKTYPLQCLMLKELYAHKFPILLGARGLSKCLIKDTYIQTNCGIKQISDLGIRDIPHVQQPISESLYGEKTYNKIEYGWYNGKKETRKITSRSGRSIECTLNHPLRVVSDGEIIWKDAEHLKLGDYLVVQRTYKQWENYNSLNKDIAYMIGAIVGDGCYSNKTGVIQFTNMDDDCIDNVNKGLYTWAQASLRQGKSQSFQYTVMSNNFRSGEIKKKFWSEFEAKPYNGGDDKETPKIIMGAHFDSIAAYLQGLFDTDGCCVTNSPIAEFSTKSKKLADETQLLLLVLGINSNLKKQFNKKYNKHYYKIVISGNSLREFKDKVGFRIKRKQDMLIKHCSRISNNNIDLVPRELFADKMLAIRELARDCKISSGHGYNYIRSLVRPTRIKYYNMSIEKFGAALDILSKSESARNSKEYKDLRDIQAANYIYDKVVKIEKGFAKTYDVHLEGDDHSFITNGFISHNSYSLAMYFLIKMLLTPGVRCVITGAGFRQAKIVFEYMEQIWKKSKMLQSCFPGKKDGPTHGTDVWTFRLGDSTTYALPVGPDGSKIRGFRANCVSGETLIKTAIGEIPISEYLNYGSPAVYNMNCELEYPSRFITTDLTDVYYVNTRSGKSLRFSKIHRLYTPSGWIFAKDLMPGNEIYCYDKNLQIFKDTVKSSYKEDKQEVLFDFTMPKTESFLGGGFVNHNCLVAEEFSCSRKSLVQTDLGLLKIEDIVEKRIKCNVFNMNGELEPIIDWIKTPKTDVYKLTTKYGYTEEVSCNHKFLTADGEWKKVVDLTNKDFIVFDDKYKFPEKEIASYGDISSNDMAYFYGLLVSEGDVTSKTRVQVMNTDRDLIDDLARRIKCLNPKIRKRDAYVDKHGWNCKESYTLVVNNKKFREFLFSQGFDYVTCHSKEIPHPILGCSKENVVCFLSGLFAGDGSIFTFKNRQSTKLGVAYYSVCERLINQLHTLLKSMGYIAYKNSRTNHISKNRQWFLRLNGKYALDFAEEIGMKNVLDFKKTLTPYVDRLRNNKGNIFFNKKSNKYLAKVHYNQKSIYLGSRDSSKSAQELIDNFNKSRKLCVQVKKVEKLDEQDHLYDISLPYTHSYYANGLVNHNSVNRAVFEEVMSGFLSVAASPIEQVEYNACMTTMKKLMIPISADIEDNNIIQNQLILSGTAYYKFNHFYQYFHKWREILYTRGDKKKLREILGADQDVENFNWKDYSIIRVPVELIPHGFMDMDQINRTKASSSADVYKREFGVCFSDDSDGFFKRSLINSCTVNEFIPIMKGKQEIKFNPALYGDKNKKYIYGIDPAYQGDNFAIVILEIHDTHRRVVHSWTTQASDHKERVKAGIVTENDYYHYCVKKIRSLMKRFPCAYIALDSDGGGKAIMEAFMDTTKLEPGEEMILPVIDPDDKPKDTDFMQGDHILHVIKFTSEWITEANHSLKKDMEAKDIIFPFHDSISYVEAEYYDESIVGDSKQLYDTLDDCIYDIEELKNELSTITISETATGKERFDTPDIKTGVSKKGRLRKDRYSALLLANWVARTHSVFITRSVPEDMMTLSSAANREQGTCFLGNNKIAKALNDLYS